MVSKLPPRKNIPVGGAGKELCWLPNIVPGRDCIGPRLGMPMENTVKAIR